MQHVDEDPVLSDFVAFAPIQVDDAPFGRLGTAYVTWEAQEAAAGTVGQIRPAEPGLVMALGDACDMAAERLVDQVFTERHLMLALVTRDRQPRAANAGWSVP